MQTLETRGRIAKNSTKETFLKRFGKNLVNSGRQNFSAVIQIVLSADVEFSQYLRSLNMKNIKVTIKL